MSSVLILQALLSVLILGKKGKVGAKEEGEGKGAGGRRADAALSNGE